MEGGRETQEGGLLLNGFRFSIWSKEKALEIDSGDGCTKL